MASRDNTRRFHFLREIASGGFGSVYLAKIMHSDGFSRLAAVKLLHQRWSANQEIAQRMRDEARLLGWLRHRNIVDVIDLTTINGRVAVIMEYLEAVDLKAVIQRHIEERRPLPARAALELTSYVASALDAAYNRPPYQGEKPLRVIHRDIKPSNIMADETGTIKVLDFGVARADFDMRESHTQELPFGSVDYMPPERLFFEPETPASDMYSLGATLYEMLALEKLGKAKGRAERHVTFLQERLVALRARPELSGAGDAAASSTMNSIEGLLREMLAYQHDQRPAAADVVTRCRALARTLEGEGLSEWAERIVGPLVKTAREAPREPNPLVDSILTEDSGLAPSTIPSPDDLLARYGGVDPDEPTAQPSEVSREDDRWKMLAEAARAELDQPPDPSALADEKPLARQPLTIEKPAPAEPMPAPASDFDDAPTRVKEMVQSGAVQVSSMPAQAASAPAAPVKAQTEDATMLNMSRPDFHTLPEEMGGATGPTGPFMPAGRPAPPPVRPDATRPDAARTAPRPEPVSPAPVSEEGEEEATPAGRPWLLPVLGVAFLFGLIVVGAVGSAGWYAWQRYGQPAPIPATLTTGTPEVTPAVTPAVTPVGTPVGTPEVTPVGTPATPVGTPSAAPIVFRSAVADLKKLSVECDGKPFTGSAGASGMEVGVQLDSAGRCVVTAMLADRSRLVADVAPVTAGTWICFAGGEKKCQPQP